MVFHSIQSSKTMMCNSENTQTHILKPVKNNVKDVEVYTHAIIVRPLHCFADLEPDAATAVDCPLGWKNP